MWAHDPRWAQDMSTSHNLCSPVPNSLSVVGQLLLSLRILAIVAQRTETACLHWGRIDGTILREHLVAHTSGRALKGSSFYQPCQRILTGKIVTVKLITKKYISEICFGLTYQYTVPPAVMDFFLVTPSLLLENKLSRSKCMIGWNLLKMRSKWKGCLRRLINLIFLHCFGLLKMPICSIFGIRYKGTDLLLLIRNWGRSGHLSAWWGTHCWST